MNEDYTYNRIESYLLRQMTEEERAAFEMELLTNEVLVRQLEQQKTMHKVLEALVEKDLLKDIKKWQAEIEPPTTSGKHYPKLIPLFRRSTVIATAIAASLIFAVALIWLYQKKEIKGPISVEHSKAETDPGTESSKDQSTAEQPIIEPGPDLTKAKPDLEPSENQSTAEQPVVKPNLKHSKSNPGLEQPAVELAIEEKENQIKAQQKEKLQIERTPPTTFIALADSYSEPIDFSTLSAGLNNDLFLRAAVNDLHEQHFSIGIEKLTAIINISNTPALPSQDCENLIIVQRKKNGDIQNIKSKTRTIVSREDYTYNIELMNNGKGMFATVYSINGVPFNKNDEIIFMDEMKRRKSFRFIESGKKSIQGDGTINYENTLQLDVNAIKWFSVSLLTTMYLKDNVLNKMYKFSLQGNVQAEFRNLSGCFYTAYYESKLAGNARLDNDLRSKETVSTAQYFIGLAYFQQKKFAEAIEHFNAMEGSARVDKERAQWLKSLAFIQVKKNEEALQLLKQITENNKHTYHENAVSLLQEMTVITDKKD